jgi:glycosyltransferase involved in cell wall biosynthesis
VAVSQQLACDLVKEMNLPAEKVVAIPNPLPVEEIRKAAMASVSHRFFSAGVPVLMAVGRLSPQKDIPTLVRAVAVLRNAGMSAYRVGKSFCVPSWICW